MCSTTPSASITTSWCCSGSSSCIHPDTTDLTLSPEWLGALTQQECEVPWITRDTWSALTWHRGRGGDTKHKVLGSGTGTTSRVFFLLLRKVYPDHYKWIVIVRLNSHQRVDESLKPLKLCSHSLLPHHHHHPFMKLLSFN